MIEQQVRPEEPLPSTGQEPEVVAQPEPERRKKKRPLFISLQIKLLFGFTLIFSVVFAGAFYWFYSFSTNDALAAIKAQLTDTINGTVANINGDDFQKLVAEGSADGANKQSTNALYQQELQWFDKVHSIEQRAIPYSYIKGPDKDGHKTNYFIVDYLQIAEPSKAAGFKEEWTVPPGSHSPEGLTQLSYAMTPYTDQWGTWVSAYTPIKNSKGEFVGALGVDFRADYVTQVQQAIISNIGLAFGITYATLLILVFLISRFLTRPITVLTRVARRIGEGDYDQNLRPLQGGRTQDEIGALAEVFAAMVAKVRGREQTLAKKVEQLTIQIDETRRQKEVTQIVESDFFQSLQIKARAMRQRSLAQSDESMNPPDSN